MGAHLAARHPPLAGTHLSLAFEGGQADALALGPLAVSEMACLDPAGVMEQEGRFLG